MLHYFGGLSRNLGTVKTLPATSFRALVNEVLGFAPAINVQRSEFRALPKERRDELKCVAYVVPCTFRDSPSPRQMSLAQPCNLVALDIEEAPEILPLLADSANLDRALEPWSYAAYHTVNSTAQAPRIRILVAADAIALEDYKAAVQLVGHRLGLKTVTPESLRAHQPMYLPTLFKDEDPAVHHPMFAYRTEGAALTVGDLSRAGSRGMPPASAPHGSHSRQLEVSPAVLEFLKAPLDGVEPSQITDALSHLDPDESYNDWLNAAAALRHQFAHEKQGALGLRLFDEWSRKGGKYPGTQQVRAKWESLVANPRGRLPITIRSLFHRAAEAGWRGLPSVDRQVFEAVKTWLAEASHPTLMDQAIRKVAQISPQNTMERAWALSDLRRRLAKSDFRIGMIELKKQLARMDKLPVETSPVPTDRLPTWARGIVYVQQMDEFYQTATGKKLKPASLNRAFGRHLMGKDNPKGKPETEAVDFLLNVAKIPVVDKYQYEPAHPGEMIIQEGQHRFANLYIPTYPESSADSEVCDLLQGHLEILIAEPGIRQHFMDYLAYCVQFPGQKIRHALLLQGAEGCGKSVFTDVMKASLGEVNVKVVDANTMLTSPFNPWAGGAQLVTVEEIRVVGHNRHTVMNMLKPCITNRTIAVNEKGAPLQQMHNVSNYLMFTNFKDALALSANDRRYYVVCSRLQFRQDVRGLGKKYFDALYEAIDLKPGAVRDWLEKHPISDAFEPNGPPPVTRYQEEMANETASPLAADIATILDDGEANLVRTDVLSSRTLKDLLEAKGQRVSDQMLAVTLRDLGYDKLGRTHVKNERHCLWSKGRQVRTLDNARKIATERI